VPSDSEYINGKVRMLKKKRSTRGRRCRKRSIRNKRRKKETNACLFYVVSIPVLFRDASHHKDKPHFDDFGLKGLHELLNYD
jgi:hypothetical protein